MYVILVLSACFISFLDQLELSNADSAFSVTSLVIMDYFQVICLSTLAVSEDFYLGLFCSDPFSVILISKPPQTADMCHKARRTQASTKVLKISAFLRLGERLSNNDVLVSTRDKSSSCFLNQIQQQQTLDDSSKSVL